MVICLRYQPIYGGLGHIGSRQIGLFKRVGRLTEDHAPVRLKPGRLGAGNILFDELPLFCLSARTGTRPAAGHREGPCWRQRKPAYEEQRAQFATSNLSFFILPRFLKQCPFFILKKGS